MTAIEAQNFQEAFIWANVFGIELSLALLLAVSVLIALIWLLSPGAIKNHDR
jgi:hypothetical protein